MPVPVDGRHNLHSLDSHSGPLGVECSCGRRAIVPGQAVGAHKGNMKLLTDLKFVCNGCGSRDWTGLMFHPHEDALAWARSSP